MAQYNKKKHFNSKHWPKRLRKSQVASFYSFFVGDKSCRFMIRDYRHPDFVWAKEQLGPVRKKQFLNITYPFIFAHLLDRYDVAVVNHINTKRIAIVLYENSDSFMSIRQKYSLIVNSFPEVLAFHLVDFEEIHLYFLFSREQELCELRNLLDSQLRSIGLRPRVEQEGDYRILPTTEVALTLPIGRNSFLLDDEMNIMAKSKQQAFEFIERFSEHCLLPNLPAELHGNEISNDIAASSANNQEDFSDEKRVVSFEEMDLDELLRHPIPGKEFASDLIALALSKCLAEGLSDLAAYKRVKEWVKVQPDKVFHDKDKTFSGLYFYVLGYYQEKTRNSSPEDDIRQIAEGRGFDDIPFS